jgi:hypothetical protein
MVGLRLRSFAVVAASLLVTESCARAGHAAQANGQATQGEWRSLMTPSAWRGYKTDSIPSEWKFADGLLSKTRPVADIVSKDQYANFELELEWKIGKAGNAGVFYRGTEEYEHIYWSGPEYQLLDNIDAADNKTPLTRAGAMYGLYPAPDGHVKPVGEWNLTKIVVNGSHVEHWLNGFKTADYELGSDDWKAKVKASKFKDWPNYGLAKKGYIALQGDHRGELAFRNIRIRELP